jgi:hypothetical protein
VDRLLEKLGSNRLCLRLCNRYHLVEVSSHRRQPSAGVGIVAFTSDTITNAHMHFNAIL